MKEKEIQELIADFPWLLNLNYELVPELPKKGMEYLISGNRIDLLLRDKITKQPVIVEFKAVPYTRDNIGQILEYRAKYLIEISRENSKLSEIFGNILSTPILILVVPNCKEDIRIACNLSGILIYEYDNQLSKFTDIEERLSLQKFNENLKESVLPISDKRRESIENIISKINDLMNELNHPEAYMKIKSQSGNYYYPMENMFLNLALFKDNDISIGVYEDIINNNFDEITIDYFSYNHNKLNEFRQKMIKSNFHLKNIPEIVSDKEYNEYFLVFNEKKDIFIKNVYKILKPYIEIYLKSIE